MSERLPSLPFPSPHQASSSGTASPRVSSVGSSASSNADSQSSFTSVSSHGPKTPPSLPGAASLPGPSTQSLAGYGQYPAMNQPGPDMYYQTHMSAAQPPAPQTSSAMPHYNPHQQPPLIQPGSQYANTAPYGQYGYPNGLTSPPTAPQVSNPMAAQNVLPPPGMAGQPNMPGQYPGTIDTTGQIAPPGMKPRVTATLWEDEGSLCFQVEARGICVARREDNHMINGTKLLNVAGMTRGRRDGILKSEKVRHVVKIGPMHLKGVWIPFERALEFANKERITDLLYPLFVHNIGALLYHPTNQTRTTQVMAAAERRKQEQSQMRSTQPPAPGLPALQPQHHHSMGLPGPQSSLPSHASMGRPSLDRAHTFPTPPTSASSVMGAGMGASDNFQWSQQGMSGAQGTNPMSIDTNLSNARSMPATPATTPPGSSLQGMQAYPPATQAYDNSRQLYNTPSTQQSPYPQSHNSPQDRSIYGQSAYVKNEMGPPSSRPSVAGPGADQPDSKTNGMMHGGQAGDPVPHHGEEEAEHEHDAEYTHNSGAYDASRASYNYNPAPVGGMPTDPSHISAEMAGSAAHQAASGRSTPRSAAAPQSYYTQGYQTPPRAQQASSNLYNVMTSDRGAANGGPGDVYAPAADMGGSLQNGYGAPVMNGAGMKRGREDEDDSASGGMGGLDMKRRKMTFDGSVPSPVYDTMSRPASAIAAPRRR